MKFEIGAREPKEEYLKKKRPCSKCKENCWLNVAGDYKVWSVVQHYCKASMQNSDLINDIFNGKKGKTKEDLIKEFNIKDSEDKNIILGVWQ